MHHEWPQFMMSIKESSQAHLMLVQVFHAIPRWASVGRPTLSHCTPVRYGGVSSNSATVEATKFAGPHKSLMRQYTTQCLLQQGTTDAVLNRHRRGYHLGAPNIRSDHSPSFPTSIFHFTLIAPPDLQLCQSFDHFAKPHRTSIDR